MTVEVWRDLALCREVDPELFFPELYDFTGYRTAKSVCAACPVKAPCLLDAIATEDGQRWGVRGGLAPEQRKALAGELRREQQVAA